MHYLDDWDHGRTTCQNARAAGLLCYNFYYSHHAENEYGADSVTPTTSPSEPIEFSGRRIAEAEEDVLGVEAALAATPVPTPSATADFEFVPLADEDNVTYPGTVTGGLLQALVLVARGNRRQMSSLMQEDPASATNTAVSTTDRYYRVACFCALPPPPPTPPPPTPPPPPSACTDKTWVVSELHGDDVTNGVTTAPNTRDDTKPPYCWQLNAGIQGEGCKDYAERYESDPRLPGTQVLVQNTAEAWVQVCQPHHDQTLYPDRCGVWVDPAKTQREVYDCRVRPVYLALGWSGSTDAAEASDLSSVALAEWKAPDTAVSAQSMCQDLGGALASPKTAEDIARLADKIASIPSDWCANQCPQTWQNEASLAWIGLNDYRLGHDVGNSLTGWEWDAGGTLEAGDPECWSVEQGATTNKPDTNDWVIMMRGADLSQQTLTTNNAYCNGYIWKPKKPDVQSLPYVCELP